MIDPAVVVPRMVFTMWSVPGRDQSRGSTFHSIVAIPNTGSSTAAPGAVQPSRS